MLVFGIGWETLINEIALSFGETVADSASFINGVFLFIVVLLVLSGVFVARGIYRRYWYGDGFSRFFRK